ncbi:hypothetical protein [Acidipropionibacterium virtanenii]|uniref:Uncharacterized protein n=1 Tax=Acidipropionibacterium virtanenii TaxID=2057246 RepID=A0A344UVH2_9ACTN|nr:hypothetical protein [Acidipropionibacterium virtanenii]AXE39270.1 hypothetical protein JS278_02118 [Acidipropionibacterium virtanenii]
MTSTWSVDGPEVGHLVTRIFDVTRTEPLVVVSPVSETGSPRIDVARLVELLPAGTEVAVLATMKASRVLSDAVDTQFQCYGGSVRAILPGAARTDYWRRHRLFTIYPEDDVEAACRLIARHVADSQGTGPARHVSGTAPHGVLDLRQAAQLAEYRRRLIAGGAGDQAPRPAVPQAGPGVVGSGPGPKPGPGLRKAFSRTAPRPTAEEAPEPEAAAPEAAPGPGPAARSITVDAAVLEELLDEKVDSIVRRVSAGVEEGLLALLNEELQAQDRERSRADSLAEQNADLQLRLEVMQGRGGAVPRVFADPGRQLRWEIEQEWLTGTPESERADGLRTFTLGPRFLDSMEAEIVPRAKTVRVMVDVLAGHAWDRHETHQFTDAPRGGKQRVRDDGATAWRTYVKAESHGAPRLTWWQCADGSVEFGHVGHHDELI